jgi:guanosine-3',5'-bis(diphosphate) 3'-pyrophosphohydrolase
MNLDLVKKAQQIAHDAHDSILHKRKYSGEPYWVHTDEVAEIVTAALKEERPDGILLPEDYATIAGAHGHDIYEDVTPVNDFFSRDFIIEELGSDVDFVILELTDVFTKENYRTMNRAERKKSERDRISAISNRSKTVKLADLISNTKSIVANDPDFARVYIKEKMELLASLVGGNSNLLARASQQVIDSCSTLGLTIPTITAQSR